MKTKKRTILWADSLICSKHPPDHKESKLQKFIKNNRQHQKVVKSGISQITPGMVEYGLKSGRILPKAEWLASLLPCCFARNKNYLKEKLEIVC
jgi:hypothetical protein